MAHDHSFEPKIKAPKAMVDRAAEALIRNGFEVWVVEDKTKAADVFWNELITKLEPKTISWGDSMTVMSLDLLPALRTAEAVEVIETFGEALSWREQIRNRKKALSADLFLTGTNAITEQGQLVNLDMIGNRVAGMTFGPRHVVLFIGTNKIVENLEAAFERIRKWSAPQNAIRHPDLKTPCQKTGVCMDCNSPQRICNTWTITEKSYPKGRIKIILIDEVLGL